MKQSRTVQLLLQLDAKQLKRFHDFANSPYFNKKKGIIKLFEHLNLALNSNSEKLFSKDKILVELKLGEKGVKELSYLSSDLLKLLEQFLVIEEQAKKPVEQKIVLMELYNAWGMEKAFFKNLKSAQQLLETDPSRNTQYYKQLFLLHAEENIFFDRQRLHKANSSLQEAADMLDVFYLSYKLKFCCELVNRKNVISSDYELKLLGEISHYLEDHPHENHPPVLVYSTILKCLQEPDNTNHFEKLKILLVEQANFFDFGELRAQYLYGVNYCVKKINTGQLGFYKDLFALYQHMLERSLLYDGEFLSPWSYKNIVEAGLRNQEFDWTEQFIKQYRSKMASNLRDNAYYYNFANWHFAQSQFTKALDLLNQVVFDDVFYSTESRMLLLRIYYELNEVEALLSLTESFKLFLRRNKHIAEPHRILYLNFVKLLARLAKINPNNNSQLQRFELKLKDTKQVIRKSWLIEKLTEKTKR